MENKVLIEKVIVDGDTKNTNDEINYFPYCLLISAILFLILFSKIIFKNTKKN